MLLATCGIIFFLLAANLHRASKKKPIELKTNCLLTRRPFVFVPGRRTPFYFLSYYNNATTLLREHGYLVEELSLPFYVMSLRKKILTKSLQRDVIWVMDAATKAEFAATLSGFGPEQLWVIKGDPMPSSLDQILFSLHQRCFTNPPSADLYFDRHTRQQEMIQKAIQYAEAEWEIETDTKTLNEINLSFLKSHDRMLP